MVVETSTHLEKYAQVKLCKNDKFPQFCCGKIQKYKKNMFQTII